MSLSQPFEFRKILRQPSYGLDAAALADVLLIALLFSLSGSRFIVAPGLAVNLDEGFALPQAREESLHRLPTVEILTVKDPNMILYQDRFFTLGDLEQSARLQSVPAPAPGTTLLLRINRNVTLDTLFRINEWAARQGFVKVLIAGQTADGDNDARSAPAGRP